MSATRPSSEHAIQIYLLALAYLHDIRIGHPSTASTWHAKEKWAGVFYIWQREQPLAQEMPIALIPLGDPVAVCTYKRETKLWQVDLSHGEKSTLYDYGDVWEITQREQPLASKKAIRNRDRKCRTL